MHSFKYVPAFDEIHLGIIFKLASADMKQLFRIVIRAFGWFIIEYTALSLWEKLPWTREPRKVC